MAPTTLAALITLKETAKNHPGASNGEKRAYRILRSLTHGEPCSLIDDFIGLDHTRQNAIVQILSDLTAGKSAAVDLIE